MKRKQRFIADTKGFSKELILSTAANAEKGMKDNPDFVGAPVDFKDFQTANAAMVNAAPAAVPKNIDGLRVFKALREVVDGMLAKLGAFAQLVIGDDPERMKASGLPLSKEPEARPTDINFEVDKAKVLHGDGVGKVEVSGKSNKAADGIIVEMRLPDKTWKELLKVNGFKVTLNNLVPDEVLILQVRYWNNEGIGPGLRKPLAILV